MTAPGIQSLHKPPIDSYPVTTALKMMPTITTPPNPLLSISVSETLVGFTGQAKLHSGTAVAASPKL